MNDNKGFDKAQYREIKKMELDNLFSRLNDETLELTTDRDKYRTYLDVQARFNRYSVSNAILVASQMPGARQLKSFADWKKTNAQIIKGERSLKILEPQTYQKSTGEQGTGFNVKKVFDISQTTEVPRENGFISGRADRELLRALISNPPVPIEVVSNMENGRNAEFNLKNQKIYIKRDLEPETFFRDVCLEMVHAGFAEGNYSYERGAYKDKAEAAAYMLCRRYGIGTGRLDPVMPESSQELKYKEIRGGLTDTRNMMNRINDSIEQSIKRQRSPREDIER